MRDINVYNKLKTTLQEMENGKTIALSKVADLLRESPYYTRHYLKDDLTLIPVNKTIKIDLPYRTENRDNYLGNDIINTYYEKGKYDYYYHLKKEYCVKCCGLSTRVPRKDLLPQVEIWVEGYRVALNGFLKKKLLNRIEYKKLVIQEKKSLLEYQIKCAEKRLKEINETFVE